MIAFFHATGYHDVVPIDQAKAQLYYTFAANGGDKGAQMALAYRYWSGIGTVEDCQRAVVWYESASEQGGSSSSLPQSSTNRSYATQPWPNTAQDHLADVRYPRHLPVCQIW